MERTPKLDDIALFLAVADAGSLAGAAKLTGASVPTLSRRLTELERQSGRHLFQRGSRGYALTAEGRVLLEEAEALRPALAALARWSGADGAPVRVRITAGTWTSRYLARNIASVWSPADGWVPEFLSTNATVDIARRQADIGIRNRRPEQGWLAGQRTGRITYAVYAAGPEATGYLSLGELAATTPSERWLREVKRAEIVATVSDARLALDLALSGVARIVMPCFAGDDAPGLMRVSPLIEALGHEEWLVSHNDARHYPPVRKALSAVRALLVRAERPGGTRAV